MHVILKLSPLGRVRESETETKSAKTMRAVWSAFSFGVRIVVYFHFGYIASVSSYWNGCGKDVR